MTRLTEQQKKTAIRKMALDVRESIRDDYRNAMVEVDVDDTRWVELRALKRLAQINDVNIRD